MNSQNRRDFLKQTTTATAVAASCSAGTLGAAALSNVEVEQWKSRIGTSFRFGDAELLLKSVDATDHSADPARPRHLRSHSVAMLFELQSGRVDCESRKPLQQGFDNHDVYLSNVVPPQGARGEFYEVVLN